MKKILNFIKNIFKNINFNYSFSSDNIRKDRIKKFSNMSIQEVWEEDKKAVNNPHLGSIKIEP